MTQELILAGLLMGLVGLTWILTIAIWEGNHPRRKSHHAETSSQVMRSEDAQVRMV
jgi:hypothetical protein